MEVTKHRNSVSYLSDSGIGCNNTNHFLVMKLHQSMFCKPKNIQNIISNQNLGVRSVHNLSTTNSFGSGNEAPKIEKLSKKETGSQEEYTLKVEKNTVKGRRHPRKWQGSPESGDNKTTDGFLNSKESESVAYKGEWCHISPSTYLLML
jgi:hypothetical protein